MAIFIMEFNLKNMVCFKDGAIFFLVISFVAYKMMALKNFTGKSCP